MCCQFYIFLLQTFHFSSLNVFIFCIFHLFLFKFMFFLYSWTNGEHLITWYFNFSVCKFHSLILVACFLLIDWFFFLYIFLLICLPDNFLLHPGHWEFYGLGCWILSYSLCWVLFWHAVKLFDVQLIYWKFTFKGGSGSRSFDKSHRLHIYWQFLFDDATY